MNISINKGGIHIINDLISSNDEEIELNGWRSDDEVIVKDWKVINFKRPPSETYSDEINKWVHLNGIIFENCLFKDVNFIGAVPMDCCEFNNCIFENCLLTDHIRWNTFNKSTFTNCIFAGYFHGNKFKPNCKFNKVYLSDFCYGNIPQSLITKTSCSESEKLELLKYFYPIESKVFDDYKVGSPYLIKVETFDFINIRKDIKRIYEINGVEYFKNIVKDIKFDLTNYEPIIRICGDFAPTIDDCIPYSKEYKSKNVKTEKTNE